MSVRRNATKVPPEAFADLVAFREHDNTERDEAKNGPQATRVRDTSDGRPGVRRLRLTRLSDVEAKSVELMWGGRLARAKINNLQGAGGLGKTFLAVDIAARWTVGAPFHGEPHGRDPGTVLYFSAEDGASDTLKPRLLAAGGDDARFVVSNATVEQGDDGREIVRALSLSLVNEIEDALRETGASLLIIDPVTSFLGAGVDMNKANEVRPVLEALNALAESLDVTMLFVLHIGKTQLSPGQAAYRALGSVDFVNVARSILVVAEQEGRKFLAHAKMNLSERADTLSYGLAPSAYSLGGRAVPTIAWQGASDLTADDLFNPGPRGGESAFSDQEAGVAMLDVLSRELTAKDLKAEMTDGMGVSRHQFERVRVRLRKRGAIAYRTSGYQGETVWFRTDRPVARGEEGDRS